MVMLNETPTDRGTMVLNMGPQHPATHGVLRLLLELDGETVVKAEPDIGFLHTGIEKTCEGLTWHQAITATDRTDYLAPLSNNLAYILAVEKLFGVTDEVPKRAQYLRVILTELTRISSHLVWLGTHGLDLGATTVFLYCFRERETITSIYEFISGVRLMTSYWRIGGLCADVPDGFEERVRHVLDTFPDRINDYETLLTRNPIFLDRTVDMAPITKDEAIAWGMTGPILRACGVSYDVRKAFPYSSYDDFDFDVPVRHNGDVYDRYLVRVEEMRQSLRIIGQALDRLPDGEIRLDNPRITLPTREKMYVSMESLIHHFKLVTEGPRCPPGEAYNVIESPRGELGCYVVSDGTSKPQRVRFRTPSFLHTQALQKLVENRQVADVVAAIGSIDIVLGEIDR